MNDFHNDLIIIICFNTFIFGVAVIWSFHLFCVKSAFYFPFYGPSKSSHHYLLKAIQWLYVILWNGPEPFHKIKGQIQEF